jgi:hypothetical protein
MVIIIMVIIRMVIILMQPFVEAPISLAAACGTLVMENNSMFFLLYSSIQSKMFGGHHAGRGGEGREHQ